MTVHCINPNPNTCQVAMDQILINNNGEITQTDYDSMAYIDTITIAIIATLMLGRSWYYIFSQVSIGDFIGDDGERTRQYITVEDLDDKKHPLVEIPNLNSPIRTPKTADYGAVDEADPPAVAGADVGGESRGIEMEALYQKQPGYSVMTPEQTALLNSDARFLQLS